jgi:spermidine/putrescine transport system substrate-binding protein
MAGSNAAPGLTRRKVLLMGGLAAAGLQSVPRAVAAGGAYEGQLNIYTWAQYQDPANIKAFSKQAGVTVHSTYYTSNEQLLAQLQTTKGQKTYDIVVPDGDHVRIEKGDGGLGLLMALDHSLIPNLKYLGPQWRKLSYDQGNKYSVPKDAGVTAFAYRTDRIKANLQSWKDFFAFLPHAKGLHVNFIESPAEVIGMALVALGHSMNTTSDKELAAAQKLLISVKPYVSTINEVYDDDFSAGKIDLGITYSGDALRIQAARKGKSDIRVVLPTGVSELWIDNWAISEFAPHPKAAHAWINFILQPKVNAAEMSYVSYEVSTPASFASVGAMAKNPKVVFPPRVFKDYEILQTTPDGLQKRVKIWDEFKAA